MRQLVILAVPFLVLVLLWDKFPPRVAIHWEIAGQGGSVEVVTFLLDHGVGVNEPINDVNGTSLMEAARRGHKDIVVLLLSRGARGATPLMHAATTYGRLDIIQTLVTAGADIHSVDGEGAKAFRKLIEVPNSGAPPGLKSLLQVGADPNWQVQNGYSALFYSIEIRPNPDIVAVLVHAKVDVNATRHQPPMGEFVGGPPPDYVYSSLIAAVKAGSVPMVKALLEGGANAHYKDSEGKTALDRAREENNPELIALLAKYS